MWGNLTPKSYIHVWPNKIVKSHAILQNSEVTLALSALAAGKVDYPLFALPHMTVLYHQFRQNAKERVLVEDDRL